MHGKALPFTVSLFQHRPLPPPRDDMVRLMQRCLHHADSAVLQAALLAVGDMVTSYGDAMLRYDRPGARIPGSSLLLDIARLTRKEPGLAQAADAVLRSLQGVEVEGCLMRCMVSLQLPTSSTASQAKRAWPKESHAASGITPGASLSEFPVLPHTTGDMWSGSTSSEWCTSWSGCRIARRYDTAARSPPSLSSPPTACLEVW